MYDLAVLKLFVSKDNKELRGASLYALVEDWFGPPQRTFHSIEEVFLWYREQGMQPELLEQYTGRFKSTSNFEVRGMFQNNGISPK
jgi:hypothetical protein